MELKNKQNGKENNKSVNFDGLEGSTIESYQDEPSKTTDKLYSPDTTHRW